MNKIKHCTHFQNGDMSFWICISKKKKRFVCIHIFTIAQSTVRPDFNIGDVIHFSDDKKTLYDEQRLLNTTNQQFPSKNICDLEWKGLKSNCR